MKYNYVVFMTKGPFEYMFKDLEEMSNVKIFWTITQERNFVIKILTKILSKLNLKWILFNGFFKKKNYDKYFEEKRPIIFIVRAGYDYEFFKTNAYDFLKKHYIGCKFVMPILDTVSSCYLRNEKRKDFEYSIGKIKNIFDLIITGNPQDVKKYELTYYPEPFSTCGTRIVMDKEHDVFFIGAAKDRLQIIHKVYKNLVDNGVDCDFWIVGVDKKDQLYDGITYNKSLKYSDMLKQSCKSKVILEIVQGGTTGFTIRACQALINNQKYITNAIGIRTSKYYNSKYILQFSNPDEISAEWILNDINVDYKYDNDYSPCEMIKYLDNYFGVKDDKFICKWQI